MWISYILYSDDSFEIYTQNDCHSFLMCLFNAIKEENKNSAGKSYFGLQNQQ